MKRKMMLTGLLAGTAMRMTPAEQRVGRFLRSPDGHEGGGDPTPAPAAAPASSEAPAPSPSPAPTPAAPTSDAMASFEAEFGDVVLPGSDNDEGEPNKGDPGVSKEAPKDDKPDPAAELEAERHRANRLEEELREARKGKEPPKDDAAPATSEDSDPAPKPDDYEFGEADSKYIAEFARWNARQEFRSERQREQLHAELNAVEDGWKTNVAAEDIAADYPDFDKVVTQGAANETWDCTPLMALAIKSSPVGPDVAYHLASNPAEAKRIASMIPVEQAWELGRLEGEKHAMRKAKRAGTPAPAAKVSSSAPPPPDKRSRGAGGQYSTEMGSLQDRMLKEFR